MIASSAAGSPEAEELIGVPPLDPDVKTASKPRGG
jgi:hypothetical protein